MIFLDSDLLVDFFRAKSDAVRTMQKLQDQTEEIVTTIFNYQELLFGVIYQNKLQNIGQLNDFFSRIKIVDYGKIEMIQTIKAQLKLRANGISIGDIDEMIAGICLTYNGTLVTRNIKHFEKIPHLKIKVW